MPSLRFLDLPKIAGTTENVGLGLAKNYMRMVPRHASEQQGVLHSFLIDANEDTSVANDARFYEGHNMTTGGAVCYNAASCTAARCHMEYVPFGIVLRR